MSQHMSNRHRYEPSDGMHFYKTQSLSGSYIFFQCTFYEILVDIFGMVVSVRLKMREAFF